MIEIVNNECVKLQATLISEAEEIHKCIWFIDLLGDFFQFISLPLYYSFGFTCKLLLLQIPQLETSIRYYKAEWVSAPPRGGNVERKTREPKPSKVYQPT